MAMRGGHTTIVGGPGHVRCVCKEIVWRYSLTNESCPGRECVCPDLETYALLGDKRMDVHVLMLITHL